MSRAESDRLVSEGRPYTLRMSIPRGEKTVVDDLVYGRVEFDHAQLDDQVLLKSDGLPTYHLANVVDDHLMEITHVLRGEEWLSSTPKHLLLYKAFGWSPPSFAHLPLLLDENRAKLSKRHRAADVAALEQDFLPEAVVNFAAQLGWTPPGSAEVQTPDELAASFEVSALNKGASMVQAVKLEWFNRQHIQRLAATDSGVERLVGIVKPRILKLLETAEPIPERGREPDDAYLRSVVRVAHERMTLLSDVAGPLAYFVAEPRWSEPALLARRAKLRADALEHVRTALRGALDGVGDWDNVADIAKAIDDTLRSGPAPYKDQMLAARFALTGEQVGPSLASIAHVLSRSVTLRRLAIEH